MKRSPSSVGLLWEGWVLLGKLFPVDSNSLHNFCYSTEPCINRKKTEKNWERTPYIGFAISHKTNDCIVTVLEFLEFCDFFCDCYIHYIRLPYAGVVVRNINACCCNFSCSFYRVKRDSSAKNAQEKDDDENTFSIELFHVGTQPFLFIKRIITIL